MAKSKILLHKGVWDYCDFWDKEVAKGKATNSRYGEWLRNFPSEIDTELANPETKSEAKQADLVKAYGNPLPTDYANAKDRKSFMNMPLYNNAYNELKPFLDKLEKVSQSIIPKELIRPNDKDLGVFSFERAMMSIDGTPALYSDKTKLFYPMNMGEPVFIKEGVQKSDKQGRLIFRLKDGGTECYLTQLQEDGIKQIYSNVKKSFLFKEKVKRPNQAVRFFVLIGNNWGSDTYWAGLTAIICAIFLESKGYSCRITAVLGLSNNNLNFGDGRLQEGHRFNMIDVKAYTETMDSLSLLYVLADPSFFRIRQFEYYMAQQFRFQDEFDMGLGRMPSRQDFKEALERAIKQREIAEEKNTLYYFLGGAEIRGIEDSKSELIKIICNAENHNKELLQKMGYEFPEVTSNEREKEYELFDCKDHVQ